MNTLNKIFFLIVGTISLNAFAMENDDRTQLEFARSLLRRNRSEDLFPFPKMTKEELEALEDDITAELAKIDDMFIFPEDKDKQDNNDEKKS